MQFAIIMAFTKLQASKLNPKVSPTGFPAFNRVFHLSASSSHNMTAGAVSHCPTTSQNKGEEDSYNKNFHELIWDVKKSLKKSGLIKKKVISRSIVWGKKKSDWKQAGHQYNLTTKGLSKTRGGSRTTLREPPHQTKKYFLLTLLLPCPAGSIM